MNPSRKTLIVVLTLLVACFGFGCGPPHRILPRSKERNDLHVLYGMYLDYEHKHGRGPSKAEDLQQLSMGAYHDEPLARLKSGDYVLIWDASPTKLYGTREGATTVLGYEKYAPTKDGYVVLMADGFAPNMTAAEFQAAPKAKSYPKAAEGQKK